MNELGLLRVLVGFQPYIFCFTEVQNAIALAKMNGGAGGTRGYEDGASNFGIPTSYIPPFLDLPPYTTTSVAIPSSTHTTSLPTKVESSSSSHNMSETPPPSIGSTTVPGPDPTSSAQGFTGSNDNAWERMGHGVRGGIIIVVVAGIIAIAVFSAWFCRGKGKWKWGSDGENGVLPLHAVQRNQSTRNGPYEEQLQAAGGDVAPPRYEEVVPPQHQRLAGGISHNREEEEAGVVADGKTPLSEIPFEDVVLDHTHSASSSSQGFSMRHHTGIGDTTGHTNS